MNSRGALSYVSCDDHGRVDPTSPQGVWNIGEDTELINNFLAIVRKKPQHNQEITSGRLGKMQQQPYISNTLSLRVACMYGRMREWEVITSTRTGLPELQNGWEQAESLLLNETLQSLTMGLLTAAPFNFRSIGETRKSSV